jgi:hypothetical protein
MSGILMVIEVKEQIIIILVVVVVVDYDVETVTDRKHQSYYPAHTPSSFFNNEYYSSYNMSI